MNKLAMGLCVIGLGFASSGRSQVVYCHDFRWIDSSEKLDLNEDGITDLEFCFNQQVTYDHPSSAGSGYLSVNTRGNYAWIIRDYNTSTEWGDYSRDYALPFRQLWMEPEWLGATGVWANGQYEVGSYDAQLLIPEWSGWLGPWAEVDVGCIAILFRDSLNQLHHASVEIMLPDDPFMPRPAIIEWKYDVDPIPEPKGIECSVLPQLDAVALTFTNLHPGLSYTLDYASNLTDGVWISGDTFVLSTNWVSSTNAVSVTTGFWRLQRVP